MWTTFLSLCCRCFYLVKFTLSNTVIYCFYLTCLVCFGSCNVPCCPPRNETALSILLLPVESLARSRLAHRLDTYFAISECWFGVSGCSRYPPLPTNYSSYQGPARMMKGSGCSGLLRSRLRQLLDKHKSLTCDWKYTFSTYRWHHCILVD